jgi:hypothetical protein
MFPESRIAVFGSLSEFRSKAESGSTVSHLFCATCSSRLFGKNSGMPGVMTVTAGTLDQPNLVEPQVAIFARSRPQWDIVDPEVQTFDGQPAWKPDDGV